MNEVVAFGPGRVNLVGEHTDYNQGLALPFALQVGVAVRARALPAPRIEAHAKNLGESDVFDLSEVDRVDGRRAFVRGAEGWRAFVRGAVGELRDAGFEVPGARLEIAGTVSRGSGLASSAALEVALVLALLALGGESEGDRVELAKLCSRIENDWVGAQTGLLDQLASLYGEATRALRIDFRTLEVGPVPLALDGFRLVTLDSGEQHANAASGYNQRRSECARACELLAVESLRDADPARAVQLPAPLNRRVRHVLSANSRVDRAVAALRRGDLERLAELLDEGHASLRDDYEVSTEAVEVAVRALKDAGALGARMLGGGFGGHILGLLAPGTRPPDGAVEVWPGPGARLL